MCTHLCVFVFLPPSHTNGSTLRVGCYTFRDSWIETLPWRQESLLVYKGRHVC